MEPSFDIADLAKEAGVSSRTIRYYGELGLLRAEGRGPGGRRIFGADALERLRFISRLKHLGLTLDEIAELNLAFDRGQTPGMLVALEELLEEQLRLTARRRRELDRLEEDLRHYLDRIRDKKKST